MNESVEQLAAHLGKLEAKANRLRTQLDAVETERGEIETTIRVLQRFAGQGPSATPNNQPNENGAIILRYVGEGENEALAPKEIQERLTADGHDLNADLVRTQLWRMAKRGILESEDGKYWKPVSDPFEEYASQAKPSSEGFGAGANSGFGSGFADDLDEDVPF